MSPVVGTAWLGRLFAPWSWSGSDLGGPAANETKPAVGRGLLARPCASRIAGPRRRHLVHRAFRRRRGGLLSAPAGASHRPGGIHPRRSRICLQRPRCHHRNQSGVLRRHGAASGTSGSRTHHGIRPVGAAKGHSPPRCQCAVPRLRIPEPATRTHDRRASRLDAAPRGVARRTDSRTPGATHPRTRHPAPRARFLLLARADPVADQDRCDLNARQYVELDLDRGPRHPCQRVLAEQRLGLEVTRNTYPYRRRLRQVPAPDPEIPPADNGLRLSGAGPSSHEQSE